VERRSDLLRAGVGLRTTHYGHLLEHGASGAAWFEVISENFFEPGGRPWAVLDRVRRDVPVVLHGIGMGLGNVAPLARSYLDKLRALITRVAPLWISDHVCWTAWQGRVSHDLLPMPYTEEALTHLVSRITFAQETLGRRMLVENVSTYVAFRASEMEEWEFMNEVARRSGCGLLLDVNNVAVVAKNHGIDPERYIDAIDPKHVGQIHVAGHTDCGTYWLDSHIGPVPEVVWELYRRALRRMGKVPTLVEWDTAVPDFATVLREAYRADSMAQEVLDGP
jgi:uncharacterized protein (UPF0276 family)